jgi:hypothetical protein
MSGLHTVHVRVNNSDTGQPTPARIRFTGPDGEYYAPLGRARDLKDALAAPGIHVYGGNLLIRDQAYAYIDGTCEIRLPAGLINVEISKGPEFQPIVEQVSLAPGKLALRFTIKRWIDLRKDGWYSGDISARWLVPHACLLEGAAEDVAVVNLLAFEDSDPGPADLYPNLIAFSGQKPSLEMPGHMVVVNTENRHPILGSLILLNCHRIVFPLYFGANFDDWTLADWCDQCHRKGGLVISTANALPELILGKVDAVQIHPMPREFRPDSYYTLLNSGLCVPLVAGGEKSTVKTQIGSARTYAFVGREKSLDYQLWIEAIRAGRTFVTYGPLLSFLVNDQTPGEVIPLESSEQRLRVRAEARSWSSFGRLQVIANGQVVADVACSGSPAVAVIEGELTMPAGGWLAARCVHDERESPEGLRTVSASAHTSAVYTRIAGRTPPVDPEAIAYLRYGLDETLEWLNSEGRFETAKQKTHLVEILESAKQRLVEVRGPQAGTSP